MAPDDKKTGLEGTFTKQEGKELPTGKEAQEAIEIVQGSEPLPGDGGSMSGLGDDTSTTPAGGAEDPFKKKKFKKKER